MLTNELFIILGPPLFAGLLIAATHAPLGIEVLRRGIIFIDLALAQIAGLGIIAADLFFHHPPALIVQLAAFGAAAMAGFFFRQLENKITQHQEAFIGVTFVLAASLTLLILADHPFSGEKTTHLLSGQILFVSWLDVFYHIPVYIFTLTMWFFFPRTRTGIWFYLLFALAITSSVQLVGVYVVFASLILPALAVNTMTRRNVPVAMVASMLAVVGGISLSALGDYPAGPVMVFVFATVSIFCRLCVRVDISD